MLIIERDGSLVRPDLAEPAAPQQAYVEIVAHPGVDLTGSIEQILAVAFDQLQLCILDLRIRRPDAQSTSRNNLSTTDAQPG